MLLNSKCPWAACIALFIFCSGPVCMTSTQAQPCRHTQKRRGRRRMRTTPPRTPHSPVLAQDAGVQDPGVTAAGFPTTSRPQTHHMAERFLHRMKRGRTDRTPVLGMLLTVTAIMVKGEMSLCTDLGLPELCQVIVLVCTVIFCGHSGPTHPEWSQACGPTRFWTGRTVMGRTKMSWHCTIASNNTSSTRPYIGPGSGGEGSTPGTSATWFMATTATNPPRTTMATAATLASSTACRSATWGVASSRNSVSVPMVVLLSPPVPTGSASCPLTPCVVNFVTVSHLWQGRSARWMWWRSYTLTLMWSWPPGSHLPTLCLCLAVWTDVWCSCPLHSDIHGESVPWVDLCSGLVVRCLPGERETGRSNPGFPQSSETSDLKFGTIAAALPSTRWVLGLVDPVLVYQDWVKQFDLQNYLSVAAPQTVLAYLSQRYV